jgi:hypothetical protein
LSEITTYFDIENSFSLYWSNFSNNGSLNTTALDAYVTDLFLKMSSAKIDKVIFGFARLCNLNSYGSQAYSSDDSEDPLMHILYLTSSTKFSLGSDFLDYLVKKAKSQNLKVGVSFGGMSQTTKLDYDLTNQGKYTYVSLSQSLSNFAKYYNLDEVNFFYALQLPLDSTTSVFANDSSGASIQSFFSNSKSQISDFTLTVGIDSLWNSNYLYNFFSGGSINTYFSQVKFLNFDFSGNYYLDPVIPPGAGTNFSSYSFPEWINVLGSSNQIMIQVGIFDKVDYLDPACNGGNYKSWSTITSQASSSGSAAALIYESLVKQLGSLSGSAFIYPAICSNNTRYKPLMSNGQVVGSKFVSRDMIDFINQMKSS